MDLFKEVVDGTPSVTRNNVTIKPKLLQEVHKRKLSEDHSRLVIFAKFNYPSVANTN